MLQLLRIDAAAAAAAVAAAPAAATGETGGSRERLQVYKQKQKS